MHHRELSQPNFFGAGSPYLAHPLLTLERTRSELDFIEGELAMSRGEPIVDVGCGFGRHSLELARRGYQVTGIDPSGTMIAAASDTANAEGLGPVFKQMRAEDLFERSRFLLALCLFTTLGQVDPDENAGMLTVIRAALQLGGTLVVELPQYEPFAANLRPLDRFETPESVTEIQRSLDPASRIVSESFQIANQGSTRNYLLRYRVYSAREIEQMLWEAGYSQLNALGGYQQKPLVPEDATMLWFASKAI